MGSSTLTNTKCQTLSKLKIKHNLTSALSAVFYSKNDSLKPSNLSIPYTNLKAKLSSPYLFIYLFILFIIYFYLKPVKDLIQIQSQVRM
jgi:hypothetical protein